MAYPYTETGYNMFDMLSMIQKSIRRGDYENAGFAANQLKGSFRTTMWNRLLVISAEDCFGVLTKELIALRDKDTHSKDNRNISNTVALMCSAKKSRDACYFACNFVLASRNHPMPPASDEDVKKLLQRISEANSTNGSDGGQYDSFGFAQVSIFQSMEEESEIDEKEREKGIAGVYLQMALAHRDMDMIGYEMDLLRRIDRNFLWDVFADYAKRTPVSDEIAALRMADDIVNQRKKTLDKDEIFISKAAILLCHSQDSRFQDVLSKELIVYDRCIDWSSIRVKSIEDCTLRSGEIPDWVYDCHTLKGRKMGKTDWDMTTTEQAALNPLQPAYFDSASWIYTYEQDFENHDITLEGIRPIREYAKTHPANPVSYYKYDD